MIPKQTEEWLKRVEEYLESGDGDWEMSEEDRQMFSVVNEAVALGYEFLKHPAVPALPTELRRRLKNLVDAQYVSGIVIHKDEASALLATLPKEKQ